MDLLNKRRTSLGGKLTRFSKWTVDLDITYVTDRVIAASFPWPERSNHKQKNTQESIFKFLQEQHGHHYMIFNLCAEQKYKHTVFRNKVKEFDFIYKQSPSFEMLIQAVKELDDWLEFHPMNVALLHCRNGRGRVGMIISCWLIFSNKCASPSEAIRKFCECRMDDKEKGLCIPSQMRYVHYYELTLRRPIYTKPVGMELLTIKLHTIPNFRLFGRGFDPWYSIYQRGRRIFSSESMQPDKKDRDTLSFACNRLSIMGDIRIEFFHKTYKHRIFSLSFNTSFIQTDCLSLLKRDIDQASEDKDCKHFHSAFRVDVIFRNPNNVRSSMASPSYDSSASSNVRPRSSSISCFLCSKKISIDDVYIAAENRVYHWDCLQCSTCGKQLHSEPQCLVSDGKVKCVACERGFFTPCSACGLNVTTDEVKKYGNKLWHAECFQCKKCGVPLMFSNFHVVNQDLYCGEHGLTSTKIIKRKNNVLGDEIELIALQSLFPSLSRELLEQILITTGNDLAKSVDFIKQKGFEMQPESESNHHSKSSSSSSEAKVQEKNEGEIVAPSSSNNPLKNQEFCDSLVVSIPKLMVVPFPSRRGLHRSPATSVTSPGSSPNVHHVVLSPILRHQDSNKIIMQAANISEENTNQVSPTSPLSSSSLSPSSSSSSIPNGNVPTRKYASRITRLFSPQTIMMGWSSKPQHPSSPIITCSVSPSDPSLPSSSLSSSSSSTSATISSATATVRGVLEAEDRSSAKPLASLKGPPEKDQDQETSFKSFASGRSVTTYPRLPGDSVQQGSPICDCYCAKLYSNRCLAVLCDGCNWGPRPRTAARKARKAFLSVMKRHHQEITSTHEAAQLLLRAFRIAHDSIVYGHSDVFMAGTTTILGGILLQLTHPQVAPLPPQTPSFSLSPSPSPLDLTPLTFSPLGSPSITELDIHSPENSEISSTSLGSFSPLTSSISSLPSRGSSSQQAPTCQWTFVCASVGDCKAFHWSARERRFREITTGTNRRAPTDAQDCGGRLGPYLEGGAPDLRNLAVYNYLCEEGDIITLVSDGIHDNLDPEQMGKTPRDLGLGFDDWEILSDEAYAEEAEIFKSQWRLRYMLQEIAGKNGVINPSNLTNSLVEHAISTTQKGRQWMESEVNKGLQLPPSYVQFPGKMDHSTCVSFLVGKYDKVDRKVEEDDEDLLKWLSSEGSSTKTTTANKEEICRYCNKPHTESHKDEKSEQLTIEQEQDEVEKDEGNKLVRVLGKSFHAKHFLCVNCRKSLVDQMYQPSFHRALCEACNDSLFGDKNPSDLHDWLNSLAVLAPLNVPGPCPVCVEENHDKERDRESNQVRSPRLAPFPGIFSNGPTKMNSNYFHQLGDSMDLLSIDDDDSVTWDDDESDYDEDCSSPPTSTSRSQSFSRSPSSSTSHGLWPNSSNLSSPRWKSEEALLGGRIKILNQEFHTSHLACFQCHRKLIGRFFYPLRNEFPVCDKCYPRLTRCMSCRCRISDEEEMEKRIIQFWGMNWHAEHFVCSKCDLSLLSDEAFFLAGKLLCRNHYRQLSS
eukprot:TRINITY_DN7678_c0_g1_i1.p1 TRINITY_DN7678_c0_g1~~TRINITY_DN7678_c0_g1_i1.p1  ORF type:complete len:1533 (-),score=269.53 TRINITY_DN7678_c0_g1_i1:227-4825(-)